ncbi:4-hydroxybenzoate 3-monooxygenase [Embleya hyalina]|uniref:4-hydroxybenzoate 3-monooxygenase n=1 Tax=Embleya hyalina TaxID=516124 RepID=A0A401YEC2_9ACTN|nr:4-hydroxybenzoate 3-monooxygenase [Embleya hyalina]GCD92937.1 4-hydroxybenzoate 3-monooxygenase [Embleya hyalina]
MVETHENTPVVIVGAGVAGLTLGNILLNNGVGCVVLEKRSRAYVDRRQRAGAIDSFGVGVIRRWGLGEVLEGDPIPQDEGGFFIDGRAMPMDIEHDEDDGMFVPQHVLVRNLTDTFLAGGGDLRFEALDVNLRDVDGPRPTVGYRDPDGTAHVVTCDFIAGADGFHGVTRSAIPADVSTEYSHEYGYSWLTVRAAVPTDPMGMAIHERGLAGMIPRGADATRIYLQCPVDDTPEQWPDERVWNELEARFGTPVARGEILAKQVVPLRSVVFDPMSHGRLYLLGDAAHIVPPMSAKGIHLALHDTDVLARAVLARIHEDDASLLESYSADCLRHIWNYQAFAAWITDLMHNAGDTSYEGEFRKQIARAEMTRLFTSPTAHKLFGELTAGTN